MRTRLGPWQPVSGMRGVAGIAVMMLAAACASEPEAPPPEPAPVAPAPEVAPVADTTYVVLFDFASTALTQAGHVVVADIAAQAQADPGLTIHLVGHADTVGPPAINERISQARADTVRNALVAAGIAPERITTEARGETDPAVPTGDNVRNQANRRVVATLM
jgi:OOP family OmpA-OmpF porin